MAFVTRNWDLQLTLTFCSAYIVSTGSISPFILGNETVFFFETDKRKPPPKLFFF